MKRRRLPGRLLGALLAACVVLGVGLASSAGAAQPLRLGFFDDAVFRSPSPDVRDRWLGQAASDGTEVVLSVVDWSAVAPAKAPGADPENPADPGYDWGTVDGFVRSATAQGLDPILAVTSAPAWAEGPRRPADAPPGTWRPDGERLGEFATALARRYSGGFADPAQPGTTLPRVRDYQAWTEPNLPDHITPQWQGKRAVSPEIYRKLLNGFYRGVKSVSAGNRVITAGSAPYGDDPGGSRVRPLRFWRDVFCLRGRVALNPYKCPAKPRLDVLAHHPINTSGPPRQSAVSPDDVSTPDIGSLERVLRAAERSGQLEPSGRRPIWITEFWWASKPPDKQGVTPARQARYVAESLYLFWKGGAELALNLRITDGSPSVPRSGTGLYYADGTPKPAARAFQFPFVADRPRDNGTVAVWGKAPARGQVLIEELGDRGWQKVGTAAAGRSMIFQTRVEVRKGGRLRATVAGRTSLPWSLE